MSELFYRIDSEYDFHKLDVAAMNKVIEVIREELSRQKVRINPTNSKSTILYNLILQLENAEMAFSAILLATNPREGVIVDNRTQIIICQSFLLYQIQWGGFLPLDSLQLQEIRENIKEMIHDKKRWEDVQCLQVQLPRNKGTFLAKLVCSSEKDSFQSNNALLTLNKPIIIVQERPALLYTIVCRNNLLSEQVIKGAILSELRRTGKSIDREIIGQHLDLKVQWNSTNMDFTACLENFVPPEGFIINDDFGCDDIFIDKTPASPSPSPQKNSSPPFLPVADVDQFIMSRKVFDPWRPEENGKYRVLYDSLVGTEKEEILQEMKDLFTPNTTWKNWSEGKYHHNIVRILQITMDKPPVLVFAGDPGTGKTALAKSIGALLAERLNSKIHFRQMSLLVRGMGYQGRAASSVVKAFEQIKAEYDWLKEPMILLFDEAEAVVGLRSQMDTSSGSQENIAIVDAIIVGVDSLRESGQRQIVVIFATNLPDSLDPALLRRCYFHRFERPNRETRQKLLEWLLEGVGLTETEIAELVNLTEPKQVRQAQIAFTQSDIVHQIIGRATYQAVRTNHPLTFALLKEQCEKALPTGFVKS